MTRFDAKGVLVTGAGSGIGRASALAFAAEGAHVMCADIDLEAAEATRQDIGARAQSIAADVTDEASVVAMTQATVDAFGSLDVAFNSAGITGPTFVPTSDLSAADFDKVTAINLRGVFLCLKYQIRAMQALPPAPRAIVNASSVAGLVGTKMSAIYAASKHGVVGLTRSAAQEVSASGIRVNAICPGWIETPMTEPLTGNDPALRTKIIKGHPIGRLGTAEEIAAAVLWLASDEASFVTGAAIAADGGLTSH